MMQRTVPSKEEVLSWIREKNNWNRWGADDQKGAINLITPAKRVAAAKLVRTGRSASLSREWPKTPAPNNPTPAQHWIRWMDRGSGGAAVDFYGIQYHGWATTHVDALCHVWDEKGLWNGRTVEQVLTPLGAVLNDIDQWREGIVTRGVLLDVPRFRGEPYVTEAKPVHGWELEEIAAKQGVKLEPGDALCVYSGREAWHAANPEWKGGSPSPGLHASCLRFLKENDIAVLSWDLMDASPNEYGIPWTMHAAIFAFGVALIDNSLLQPLAEACAQEGRCEFMLTVAPLRVVGGTGSPANPLALF
ncbi:MAG TPA: cyclase family protein [Dehalococcoidia bacterium]|nr:cyclase family protein [Dehalococcoidia bacterium]